MFVNIPNNFSSMWGEIIYEYNSVVKEDVVIAINEARTGKLVGVKKFYSVAEARFNLAPIIFDMCLPAPYKIESSHAEILGVEGFPAVTITVGSSTSSPRYFTYAHQMQSAPRVMTTMPENRILYAGESDSIWHISSSDKAAKIELHAPAQVGGESTLLESFEFEASEMCGVFHIAADDYNASHNALIFKYLEDGEVVKVINYSLENRVAPGYRVAWISSQGSVEHYTFPVVIAQSHTDSGARVKSIRSAYGARAEIEALSEIVSSVRVWNVDSRGYVPIKVLTTEQSLTEGGALSIVTLKIEEDGKGKN